MASNNATPESKNREWGFYGTINHHGDAGIAWPIAINTISDATQLPAETVAIFLDSRHGRQFANELATAKVIADAIEAATTRWMAWRISARTAHETGIPRGLPYLIGFAIHAEIEADTAD